MSTTQLILDRRPVSNFVLAVFAVILLIAFALFLLFNYGSSSATGEYIIQANDVVTAAAMVEYVGGEVTYELGIINAVGARLNKRQLRSLQSSDVPLRIYLNSAAQVQNQPARP